MKRKIRTMHFGILMLFSFIVFFAVLLNSLVAILALYLLVRNGVISISGTTISDVERLIGFFMVLSIPVGVGVALLASNVPLKPIRDLIHSMDSLASGHFETRVNVGSVMRRYPPFVAVAESFNMMAEELENTELLRMDFVNNISHEFKTPIASIAGFAKLLRKGNLSPEQQREYLAAIEEESIRLSSLATNVLNLTKVENQTILTDVTWFNLSEQIRSCILILESKWENKGLDLQLEFGEHRIQANMELLKQVWINLLDNAIKFAPNGHTVQVKISETEDSVTVAVMNTGSEIPPEHQKKIFNKFYQVDESHSTQGNGVGLAIVKRIVQLHSGEISVSSDSGLTVFTVRLPKRDTIS